jgi:hypothetical protein
MTKKLNSKILQEILNHLIDEGYKITFEGQAWSNMNASWVYFNTPLNIDLLITRFDSKKELKIHKNEDPRSGREKGLIDESTDEGITGEF